MRFFNKKLISVYFIPLISLAVLAISMLPVKAFAGTITHSHTESCYQNVTKTCNNHTTRTEYEIENYYCDTCNGITSYDIRIYYDQCPLKLVGDVEGGRYERCMTCGSVRTNQTIVHRTHTYTAKELCCGKNDGQTLLTLSLEVPDRSWTNGNVTISAVVDMIDASYSLAAAPYDFGSGYGTASSMEVSENGTYSVSVKGSDGSETSASVTVSNIDRVAPTLTLSKDTEAWSESGVTVIAEGSDSESGLKDAAYSFNGGDYSSSNTFKVTANGTVSVSVADNAGNVTTSSITVKNVGRDPAVVAAEKAAAEKAAAEKAAAEKAAAEKAAAEKAAAEKAAAEKAAAEKAAAVNAARNTSQTTVGISGTSSGTASQSGTSAQTANSGKNSKTSSGKLISSIFSKDVSSSDEDKNTRSDASSNDASGNDVSDNSVSGNLYAGIGGGLLSVTDKTGGSGETVVQKETLTIETLTSEDIPEELKNADDTDPVNTGMILLISGLVLAVIGIFVLSFFNYVYVVKNGKPRPVALAKVKKQEKRLILTVPGEKLKKHGKYMIYLSPWMRLNRKNRNVYIRLKEDDSILTTEDGVSFAY